jgi:hypothetical protein
VQPLEGVAHVEVRWVIKCVYFRRGRGSVGDDSKCESIVSNVREGINHLLQTILPKPP